MAHGLDSNSVFLIVGRAVWTTKLNYEYIQIVKLKHWLGSEGDMRGLRSLSLKPAYTRLTAKRLTRDLKLDREYGHITYFDLYE